ncbi:MAG: hypothetical protein M1818_000013 [Claussenomyces sp. TS43310]|nr:MAG: hypothetical protein M1818_000013 [Claussenomyces sp. TS43310]
MAGMARGLAIVPPPPPLLDDAQKSLGQKVRVTGQLKPRPTPAVTSTSPNAFSSGEILGIYRNSHSDMQIGASKDSPPLYYIETHSSLSPKPSLILHTTKLSQPPLRPSTSDTSLSSADFHSFSSTIDIYLNQSINSFSAIAANGDAKSTAPPGKITLSKSGWINIVFSFGILIPETNVVERFDWQASTSRDVRALDGHRSGFECTRKSTGESIAVFTGVPMSRKKVGKMRWNTGSSEKLGSARAAVEVAVLTALLALLERRMRQSGARSGSAVGGGGAATGGVASAGAGF